VRIDPSLSIEYYLALYTNTNTFLDLISNIYYLPITAAVTTTIITSIAVAVAVNTRIAMLKLLEFSY
jgi:hypothetical protein